MTLSMLPIFYCVRALIAESYEHQRRSSDCKFFTLLMSEKPKVGRPRKGRTSKASRGSELSNFAAVPESSPVIGWNEPEGRISSALSMEDIEMSQTKTRGTRVMKKSKKTSLKPKTKAIKAKKEESAQASSFVEPEDDDFEVKIEKFSTANRKTLKRTSDEINKDHDPQDTELTTTSDFETQSPPAKRRVTRTRSSTAYINHIQNKSSQKQDKNEIQLFPSVDPAPKNGTRKGRKPASSTMRNASAPSTSSTASLRDGIPDSHEIHAELAADLDRPLTDNESGAEQPEIQYPKLRRLTRSKPGSRNGNKSVAPVRKNIRTSAMTNRAFAPKLPNLNIHETSEIPQDVEDDVIVDNMKEKAAFASASTSCQEIPNERTRSKEEGKSDISPDQVIESQADVVNDDRAQRTKLRMTNSKTSRTRQPFQVLPARDSEPLVIPPTYESNIDPDIHSSRLESHSGEDETGHEADSNATKEEPKKRGRKKMVHGAKRGKTGKKIPPTSRNVGVVQKVADSQDSRNVAIEDFVPNPEPEFLNRATVRSPSTDQGNAPSAISGGNPALGSSSPRVLTEVAEAKTIESPLKSPTSAKAPGTSSTLAHFLNDAPEITPPPALPSHYGPAQLPPQTTPRPAASPQSSDVENQPPSSRPSTARPPLSMSSASKPHATQIPVVALTPTTSPSRRNHSRLLSTVAWTAIEMEKIFCGSPDEKENNPFSSRAKADNVMGELTSPERTLSVEEWIKFKAKKGEEILRTECESFIGKFEGEGMRALRTLEGLTCVE